MQIRLKQLSAVGLISFQLTDYLQKPSINEFWQLIYLKQIDESKFLLMSDQ